MAFPLPQGLTPREIEFLCEMELVTVIPRQRLDRLDLLGGPTQPLAPPRRGLLPLWLALLLKQQRRANILPPAWFNTESISLILDLETNSPDLADSFSPPAPLTANPTVDGREDERPIPQYTLDGQNFYQSPPFLWQNVAEENMNAPLSESMPRLPYHWLEIATMLLDAAGDDIADADQIRLLIRDLREVRQAKMRKKTKFLDMTAVGGQEGLPLTGAGAMEIGEARTFMMGVAETLRQIGAPKEETLRETQEEAANQYYEDGDEEMEL